MSHGAEVIELSSDEDEEPVPSTTALARHAPSSPPDVKPLLFADVDVKPLLLPPPLYPPGYGALVPVKAEEPVPVPVATASPPPRALPPSRLCRQFWKSGDYVVARRNPDADGPGGRNRLRINPRFLHSNATSHKWAFGAIAELLDNAIDEVNNGATFVRVNKFTNPRDGNPSLLVQDDGGGMDPEALRRCMSFGFSDKQSDAFIGQYGNGFKTSTMRLGADVIVFTQNQNNWVPTRSIGLLSYTFLMETGCDDVLVPMVDYQYDVTTTSYVQMLRHDQKLFSSNLGILLKWSPFATEAELLKQFDDMGDHGTKIIVFNLWLNDDGDMELDFNSDKKDIIITGAHKKVKTNNPEKIAAQNYVSTRLRYSLRAYASILYLHVPDTFRIILRGHDVEPHNIVNDLMYRECVLYKPQIAGLTEESPWRVFVLVSSPNLSRSSSFASSAEAGWAIGGRWRSLVAGDHQIEKRSSRRNRTGRPRPIGGAMVVRLRGKEDAPPQYGPGCGEFTIELHHGGFFVGFGHLRSYVDEKVDWFDGIDSDEWSALWFEDFVQQLGYQSVSNMKFYWLLPGKNLSDGLRVISSDSDTNVMVSVLGKVKNLVVYVDHQNDMATVDWDDFVANPLNEMPPVLSPHKFLYVDQNKAEKLPVNRRVDQSESSQQGPEEAECFSEVDEFLDSDNEISEGDDDLQEDAINLEDKQIKGNKKAKGSQLKAIEISREPEFVDDSDTEDDELHLPDSDGEGEDRLRFTSWRPEELNSPKFFVGLVFPSVEKLREVITDYSVKNRVEIKLPRNDQRRVRAHCAEGCPWNLYASFDSRVKSFVVKTYHGKHTCQKEWVLKKLSSRWLANKYIDSFRANEKMSITNFGRTVQKDLNLTPSRSMIARAKRIIMRIIHGNEDQQYDQLWDYGEELRRSNPGSSLYLNLAGNLFSTCFMSLDACKRGLLAGCRPIICLDGCHIKTKYGGQLLTAIGMDPNDCIYPIAIGVVEVESFASWSWFLQTLKEELQIDNTYPWTIMTDKQKGLIPAVRKVFPESEHRFCVRHLYSNFQEKFKGEVLKNQLWACARSSSVQQWNRNMEKMKVLNPDAHKWLEKMEPNTWVRAYFSIFPKCDILLNNNCEVFNKYILEARELPILSMLETIKCQLMSRHYNKQKELAEKFKGPFCPKIAAKVAKNAEFANLCFALPAGSGVFQVQIREYTNIVDILAKTCDCRRWQLTGIPCCHAIACLRHERIPPESVLPPCYSIESFSRAYGFNIWPCRDKSEWTHVNGPKVLPPVYEKKIGRPPKSRKKQPHEVQGKSGAKFSKHGVTMHCKHCSEANHNSNGCKLKKQGFTSTEAKAFVANTQAQVQREAEEAAVQAAYTNPDVPQQLQQPINQAIIQEDNLVPISQGSSITTLNQMLSQETTNTMQTQNRGLLPDSHFIESNNRVDRPMPLTTATKAGKEAVGKKRTTGTTSKGARGGAVKRGRGRPRKIQGDVQQEGPTNDM